MENQKTHPINKFGKPAEGPHGSGSYMKGKDVHPGVKKRQDGKNSKKGGESHDGLWQHHHSEAQGELHAD